MFTFNNFSPVNINENMLLEELITESIQIYGHDVKYLPRESYDAVDNLFGEDVLSKFSRAYTLDMYMANVEGYEGQGDFFSKFGLEVRDSSNFVVSYQTFNRWVPSAIRTRPREGDLIYVPVLQKLFEIKFVEEELLFFSLGRNNPYMYELRCEVFRYSNENLNTGVDDIDSIEDSTAYAVKVYLGSGAGNYNIGETVYQGTSFLSATFTGKVTDWSPFAKELTLINVSGSPTAAVNLIGATTNTQYLVVLTDDMDNFTNADIYDNRLIQTEANNIMVLTESNPFGAP